MTRDEFSALCACGPVILDGAMGSNLMLAGMPRGVCAESWALSHPETVKALLRAYVDAGSRIIYAPTFGANRVSLRQFHLDGKISEINRGLLALAREAADGCAFVAGDMTTLGHPVEETGAFSYDALLEVYREQAQLLSAGGADLLVIETMMGVSECMAAVEAARSVCALPIICTLSVQTDGKCYFDGNAAEAAAALEALGADAVGVNCASGPDQLESLIAALHRACALPIAAKPNAGLPQILPDGTAAYPMDAAAFAGHMARLSDAGATLLGGCCGTDPSYIRALSRALFAA